MGVWEFLDEIEEDVEDGAKALGRGMGKVADQAAHLVGDGLDALGLHTAAEAVDGFGDSVADTFGAQVGEAQLGETEDPVKLVHGDGDGLKETVKHLGKFATAFDKTADGLSRIDSAHWTGAAADAFRANYEQHPAQWADAAQACQKAATAMASFATAVLLAQAQAGEAVKLYGQAKQASAQARAAYNQQVDRYNWALTAGTDPGQSPGDFADPGAEVAQRAQQLLTDARARRNAEGDRAAAAMAEATAKAPTAPRFTERLLNDAGDLVQESMDGVTHFYGGMAKGAGGILKFGRTVNPLDPYNLTHPAEYVAGLSGTAAGLLHTANHPMDLVEGMLGDGWGSDPFEAMGKLIPNAALGLATDGAGGAAEAAGERLAVGVGEDAAEQAGLAAGRAGAADAGVLGERTAGYTDDLGGFGDDAAADFGPQGSALPEEPPPAYYEKPDISDRLDHFDESGYDYSDPLGNHGDDVPPHHDEPAPDVQPDVHHAPPEEHGGPLDESRVDDYSDRAHHATHSDHEAFNAKFGPENEQILQPQLDRAPDVGLANEEVRALDHYTGPAHQDLNLALRENDLGALGTMNPEISEMVSGLNKLPPHVGPVYRGVEISDMEGFLDRYQVGRTVEESAFTSADMAAPYSGNVQMTIESTGGRDISWLKDPTVGQREVLFPPGSSFEVVARSEETSGNWKVVLREVGH